MTTGTTTHTPGPWQEMESRTLIHIETGQFNSIGAGIHICSVPKSAKGNAAALAALPELINALEAAKGTLDEGTSISPGSPLHNVITIVLAQSKMA